MPGTYKATVAKRVDGVITPPATGEAPATLDETGNPAFCSIWTLLGVLTGLEIVDVAGRRVWGTSPQPMTAGTHTLDWDGRTRSGSKAGQGIYFARLMTTYGVRTAKIVLD